MRITYTVKRNEHGEYVARFHVDGKFQSAWTAYETDREAAEMTAQATVRHFNEHAATLFPNATK